MHPKGTSSRSVKSRSRRPHPPAVVRAILWRHRREGIYPFRFVAPFAERVNAFPTAVHRFCALFRGHPRTGVPTKSHRFRANIGGGSVGKGFIPSVSSRRLRNAYMRSLLPRQHTVVHGKFPTVNEFKDRGGIAAGDEHLPILNVV